MKHRDIEYIHFQEELPHLSRSENIDFTLTHFEYKINTLNLQDTGNACKELYFILKEMHQVQLPPKQRFACLEILQPHIQYLCQLLNSKCLVQESQFPIQKRKVASLAHVLQIEMLHGHKLIIHDCLPKSFLQKGLIFNAICRAMTFMALILFRHYQMYSPAPKYLWKELHGMYRLAKSLRLLKRKIAEPENFLFRHHNLVNVYLHCCLLAMVNPSRFKPSELSKVNFAFEQWASYVSLSPVKDDTPPLFLVDLNSDAPPMYRQLIQQSDPLYLLGINLKKLMPLLEKELASSQNSPDPLENKKQLPLQILKMIHQSWNQFVPRGYERSKAHGHLRIALGMMATHALIQQTMPSPYLADNHDSVQEEINLDEVPLPESDEYQAEKVFSILETTLVDQSPGGFCVQFSSSKPMQLHVGKIIGLEFSNENDEVCWGVGCIRWLKELSTQNTQVGIQVLSQRAHAVNAKLDKQTNDMSPFEASCAKTLPTLLLPRMSEHNQSMSLIAPILPFKLGQTIDIVLGHRNFSVTLSHLLSHTNSYNQFELSDMGALEEAITPFFTPDQLSPEDPFWNDC